MNEPTLAEQIAAAISKAVGDISTKSSVFMSYPTPLRNQLSSRLLSLITEEATKAALATLEASQTREAAILRLVEAARAIQETWTAEDIDIGRRCRVPDDLKQIELFDALDAIDAIPASAERALAAAQPEGDKQMTNEARLVEASKIAGKIGGYRSRGRGENGDNAFDASVKLVEVALAKRDVEIERLHELVRKQAIALANLMPARGGSKEELQSQADAIHDHIEVVNSEYENGIREGRRQMREEAVRLIEQVAKYDDTSELGEAAANADPKGREMKRKKS